MGEEKCKIYTPAVKRSIKIRQYIIKGRYLKFIVSGESENEKYILKSNAKIRNDLRKQQYAIEDLVRKTREHPAPSLSSMRSSLLKIWAGVKRDAGFVELTCRFKAKGVYSMVKDAPDDDAIPEDKRKVSKT